MKTFIHKIVGLILIGWLQTALSHLPTLNVEDLPLEARHTLYLIQAKGPFPYWQDDSVFGNFEKQLPIQPYGYYHEYTVPTPGARDRGKRRIVVGEGEYYYTRDHYQSFFLIKQ